MVARWVPKLFYQMNKSENGTESVAITEIMEKREIFLDHIATGDETWFHYHEPETKFQSIQWKRKLRVSPSELRVLPQQANGWPPYSGIERVYCQSIGFQRKLPSTAIIT